MLEKIYQFFCSHDWEVEQNEFYWWKRTCNKCGKVIDKDVEKKKRWAKEDLINKGKDNGKHIRK